MKSTLSQVHPDEFVVRIPTDGDRSELLGQIGELGTARPLPAHPDLVVLHLGGTPKGTAKGRWQKLRKAIGSAAFFPVFVDETRSARFPVGTIMVRFKSQPTASELAHFAEKFGLAGGERNTYAPAQVAFAPPDDAYLPELIERIAADADLEAVWPETLAAFKR